MAKKKSKKKNKKHNSLYKSIKPFVKDNRVLLSILGAAGVGVALASAFGQENVRDWLGKLSATVTGKGSQEEAVTKSGRPAKSIATAA